MYINIYGYQGRVKKVLYIYCVLDCAVIFSQCVCAGLCRVRCAHTAGACAAFNFQRRHYGTATEYCSHGMQRVVVHSSTVE